MPRPITHGASGYRRGCRCEVCRAAHREANAAWRSRKRAEEQAVRDVAEQRAQALADTVEPVDGSSAPAVLDPHAAPGPLETALDVELKALVGEPPWKATLSALARANARIVDQLPRHERFDVISGVQLRFMDVLDRLRRVPETGGGASGGVPLDWSAVLGDDE